MTTTKKYIATETTLGEIKSLVQQIHTKLGTGGNGSIRPHITVMAPTGCTITASNRETVLSAEEENGIWQFEVPFLGTWALTATKDGHSATRNIVVESVKEYRIHMSHGLRYGFRIKKGEGNPSARVEYLFDAVGMEPAHMDFTRGIFDYGDWGDKWFVTENKPLMLRSNGQVGYYLNPNNYDKKEDGTASDISDTAYDGNAMAQFPLVWVYRYEDTEWEYEIISDVQYDENYEAYSHTRADGSIAEYFYWSMFGGSGSATKIRSLAGQTLAQSLTAQNEIAGCVANGDGWYTHTWSQHELIRTLLILMGKSTDAQSVFGNGNCRSASNNGGLLQTGTLKNMGQFFGYNDSTHQVKVFHVEKFWGDQWDRTAGLINSGGRIWVKMTPEDGGYRVTDVTGYTDTGITLSGTSGGYINTVSCSRYGIIPKTISGSGTTFYCDGAWFNNSQLDYLIIGASALNASALGGGFPFSVNAAPGYAYWDIGCGLSFISPVAA